MAQIVGLLIAIAALLAMLPGLLHWTTLGSQQVQGTAAAQQAAIFNQAAGQYLAQQSGALLTNATATTPVIVTAAQLQTLGFLPTGFSAANIYGQTWQLEVLQPTPGTLEAVSLTTGGGTLKDAQAANLAQLIGAAGGFIPLNDSGVYPQPGPALRAYGTQGAWQLTLTNFSGVSKGHLATYLSLIDSTGQLASNNYLYRNAVPGNPDLNTMHTPLVLSSNASWTVGSDCSAYSTGAVTQDGSGALIYCSSAHLWTQVGGGHWKDPAGSFALLPTANNSLGDVRLTTDTNRAYAWTGGSWSALAIDQNGDLLVPGALTVNGNATVNGSATISQTVTATNVVTPGNAAGLNSTGSLWAANGQFVVNNNGWGMQPAYTSGWAMVTNNAANASAQSPIGSIHVNDLYDRASGQWFSQVASNVTNLTNSVNSLNSQVSSLNSSVSTLNSNVATLDNTVNFEQSEINNLQAQLNAIGPIGAQLIGYTGPVGPSGGRAPSATISARAYSQLVTVAAIAGMSGTGSTGGSLCSPNGWGTNHVTLQARASGGATLANQAAASEPPQYLTYVTWPLSITFIVPPNQSATITLTGGPNNLGCGTFTYAAFAL